MYYGIKMNFSEFFQDCDALNKEKDELVSKIKKNEQDRIDMLCLLSEIIDEEFDKYDLNKDGFIDFYEYLMYTVSNIKKGKTFEEDGDNIIKKFHDKDKNDNKLISKNELLREQASKLKLDDLLDW